MNFRFSICDFRFKTVVVPTTGEVALPKSQITNHQSQVAFRGFTLVEILVVIAIIAILLGIGLLVGPEVLGSGNKQATYALLNNCQAIAAEYQSLVKMPVNNYGTTPIDWGSPKNANVTSASGTVDLSISSSTEFQAKSIEQFVYATYKIDAIRTKLYAGSAMSIGTDSLLGDTDPTNNMLDLHDAWGNKIAYIASNAQPKGDISSSDDGYTYDDIFPAHSSPYFASAGPDGKWGDAYQIARQKAGKSLSAAQQTSAAQAADNLYSFDAP